MADRRVSPIIPESELVFVASRSSGPGGQHVNRTETKVTLLFDLEGSGSLTVGQKRRLRERLATRISREGILRVTSQKHRSREANRKAAVERFADLLEWALAEARPRKPTRPGAAARARRLEGKRRRAETKQGRARPAPED
jgi:ribosome-associated protein